MSHAIMERVCCEQAACRSPACLIGCSGWPGTAGTVSETGSRCPARPARLRVALMVHRRCQSCTVRVARESVDRDLRAQVARWWLSFNLNFLPRRPLAGHVDHRDPRKRRSLVRSPTLHTTPQLRHAEAQYASTWASRNCEPPASCVAAALLPNCMLGPRGSATGHLHTCPGVHS